MKTNLIKQAHTRLVSVLVKELIQSLHLATYKDVYTRDAEIERITCQRLSLLQPRIAEIVDCMIMDALHLHFHEEK